MADRSFNYVRRKLARHLIAVVCVGATIYFLPYLIPVYAIFGLLDISRHERIDYVTFKRYFWGNGFPTLLLAPFNLLIDLISKRNHYVFRMQDLPEDYQAEITHAITNLKDRREELIDAIDQRLADNRRGMLFLKWYDKKMDQSVFEFDQDYRYIKTVAVSVFNKHQQTKLHFGPLRLTYRVLYNLTPVDSDQVYIQVGQKKHFWKDDPLFIFDDTLIHKSANLTDNVRYCLFMDIVRPSRFPAILEFLLHRVNFVMQGIKTVFYKNWAVIR
ncbi:aspartyl/asparaginyl beta-hydroxylase domain-containing protein [Aestuariispira insulae]|uniref:Beta-hydroxylase n=1 Tax=Aestuariispira insulae TaxID=1461337 RepID=A0A3D9HTL4_9PROT|nr:aspartyl/asparaginyl beta-hydroxylase domain-containing protein [Aestuariispira insulae]RED52216.1 beta-hydroxylase [Aestuariispira insulae]